VVTVSKTSTVYGEPLSFTAIVSAVTPVAGTPGGLVRFLIDGMPLDGTFTLVDGVATGPVITTLTPYWHTVTAEYVNVDGSFDNSSGSFDDLYVGRATTTVSVGASAAEVPVGTPVIFTATVTADSPSTAVATGSIQFMIDGISIGDPVPLVAGRATGSPYSELSAGAHTVTAVYTNLDGNFDGGADTLPGGLLVTGGEATTTTLSSSATTAVYGQAVTLTAAVNSLPGSSPTGTVTFFDGAVGNRVGLRHRRLRHALDPEPPGP
jgi:hypothetical protein